MDDLTTVLSIVAMLGCGMIGGVFFAFSSFVMRALARLPDAQGLAAMQSINVVVLNWHFLGLFLGTAVISLAAIVSAVIGWNQPGSAFVACGGALYLLGTFLVTARGNVPLNNALVGVTPESPDAAVEWKRYLERWTQWNHVRTGAAAAAAVLHVLAIAA